MQELRWSALYYPYADFRDPNLILRAALYYDEVYFLQPGFFKPPQIIREGLDPKYWPEVDKDLKSLYEREILREVDSGLLGIAHTWMPEFGSQAIDEENHAILLANMRSDIENKQLQQLSVQHGKLAWSFPNMQFIGIAAAGLLFEVSKSIGRSIGIEYVTDNPLLPVEYSDLVSVYGPDTVESRISPSSWDRERVLVPFHVGEALMVNIALLASTRLSATPLTDSPLHHLFLQHKMRSFISDPELREWLGNHGITRHAQAVQLAERAIEITLPEIKPLTAKQVLRLRSKCSEELKHFRVEMTRLATMIENTPWESGFEKEVRNIVDAEIRPAIGTLEGEFKKLQRELAIKVVEKSIGASPLSIIATLFTGLPIEIALAAAVGVGALSETLRYWHEKKTIKSNGFSYLLKLARRP